MYDQQTQENPGRRDYLSPHKGSGAVAGANLCDRVEPGRSLEIPVAVDTLNDRVEVLHKELSALDNRLQTILRPQPPNATQPGPSAYGAGTTLGGRLASATTGVDMAIGRVRMMLDLLEL